MILTMKGDGPIALVLVPTRELALQIYEEVQKFALSSCIKCLAVYGGTDKQEQLKKLQNGTVSHRNRIFDSYSREADGLTQH